MNRTRFDRAMSWQTSGHEHEAVAEFLSMAAEASEADEKASLLLGAVKCFSLLGLLEDADRLLGEIGSLPVEDNVVRISVDFVGACVADQRGVDENSLARFDRLLNEYRNLLSLDEHRDLYEEIRRRRAICLVRLFKYKEALPLLLESGSFETLTTEAQQELRLYFGICYDELNDLTAAKEQYLRAVSFGLRNDVEVDARYRVGVLYFSTGGFAQARYQFEAILQINPDGVWGVSKESIYLQLATICWQLGDKESENRYLSLGQG